MELKRGETLSFVVRLKTTTGQPITGAETKLLSQVRDNNGKLLASFTIEETVVLGDYTFSIPAVITNTFPLATIFFDIAYKDGDVVAKYPTVELYVLKDVTQYD
jgi:hypothetical protein